MRLWKERTKGEAVRTLREMTGNLNYRPNEIGKRDHFPRPYYGKMYGDEKNPRPKEMMTKTFVALLGGNFDNYRELTEAPDLLYFGLALLIKYWSS